MNPSFKLEQKLGSGSVKVSLRNLSNGSYMHRLLAAEQLIDTKRLQFEK
jgi:hypothetical protein